MARTYVMMLAELLRRRSLNLAPANNLSLHFGDIGDIVIEFYLVLHYQSQRDLVTS